LLLIDITTSRIATTTRCDNPRKINAQLLPG